MKYIIFGAGNEGLAALYTIGSDKVIFFLDNNKEGKIDNIPIYSVSKDKVNRDDTLILISSVKYCDDMAKQLENLGCKNFALYKEGKIEFINSNEKMLSKEKWSKHYNIKLADNIINAINSNKLSVWTEEMLKITKKGQSVLEIGCGSGMTSLALAKNGREVTALDYSEKSIELVDYIAAKLECTITTCVKDATLPLDFDNKVFDFVFQAGLLEHFDKEKRIELLKLWKPTCKHMISFIPNAHSLAYRVGKFMMEQVGTWEYGLEMPQSSLYDEFELAGYKNIREYTIGEEHALKFLPNNHYLRVALEKCIKEKLLDSDNYGQGYLLVTIGQS